MCVCCEYLKWTEKLSVKKKISPKGKFWPNNFFVTLKPSIIIIIKREIF